MRRSRRRKEWNRKEGEIRTFPASDPLFYDFHLPSPSQPDLLLIAFSLVEEKHWHSILEQRYHRVIKEAREGFIVWMRAGIREMYIFLHWFIKSSLIPVLVLQLVLRRGIETFDSFHPRIQAIKRSILYRMILMKKNRLSYCSLTLDSNFSLKHQPVVLRLFPFLPSSFRILNTTSESHPRDEIKSIILHGWLLHPHSM